MAHETTASTKLAMGLTIEIKLTFMLTLGNPTEHY